MLPSMEAHFVECLTGPDHISANYTHGPTIYTFSCMTEL
jgi:hypothetical protein